MGVQIPPFPLHHMTEDNFTAALRTVMQEGGFQVFRIYTPDPEDPAAVIEAVLVARSPEMLEAAALDVLSKKTETVN